MTDLKDRLDDLVTRERFEPLAAGSVVDRGRRVLRRRRVATAVGACAAAVVAFLVVSVAVRYVTQPDLEFGDPAGRRPATGGVTPEVAYPDLVTSRSGDDDVEITGFGWPLAEMDPDDISRLDAESMCLPMLEQAAPEVPASAWQHSESWVDSFPSKATLPTTMAAEHDGRSYYATCALPGDYVPELRPDLGRVPSTGDELGISRQCAYLGHVDLTDWDVAAAHSTGTTTIAALRSPDGRLLSCVLSQDPAGRSVQLTRHPEPLTPEDALVFHQAGRSVLVAGPAPASAAAVELRAGGRTEQAGTDPSTFAIAVDGVRAADPTVRLTFYDEAGDELASYSTTTPGEAGALLPAVCFYSLETGNDGC